MPPIVGVSPMTRSTRPNFAFSDARMRSHATATSNAQVRVSACAANTVGNGNASMRFGSSIIRSYSCRVSALVLRAWNCETSTPPETILPSARMRSARGAAASISSSARSKLVVQLERSRG